MPASCRDTYAAYRKAGYSKKFLSEHESEITLHMAAKRCFDEMGLTKLPTVKSLQAEYAALMAEKKEAYIFSKCIYTCPACRLLRHTKVTI